MSALYPESTAALGSGYGGDPHSRMHGRTLVLYENALAYGADPTGVQDSTSAIQAAIDAIGVGPEIIDGDAAAPEEPNDGGGGTVFLPKGLYKISRPIVLSSYQHLTGAGAGTIIKNTGAGAAIEIGNGVKAVHRCDVTDLTIDGGAGDFLDGGHGIWARRWFRGRIDHVWVWGCKDIGMRLQGVSYGEVTNCYVQVCRGYGIKLQGAAPPDHATATNIVGNTIRLNYRAGLFFDNCITVQALHNTIESNGVIGDVLGTGSGTRALNMWIKSGTECVVNHNYFEQSTAYSNQSQLGITDGYQNWIESNYFGNYVGLVIWCETGAVTENTIQNNVFPVSSDPNMITSHKAAITLANANHFIGNRGMNWLDSESRYDANTVSGPGQADGLEHKFQSAGPAASYTPDLGVINSGAIASAGRRKGRILQVTLTEDCGIQLPTNGQAGEEITYIFIEDVVGGWDVTWHGQYKVSWDNTGNTAGLRSTIKFLFDGGAYWVQIGAQSPWV